MAQLLERERNRTDRTGAPFAMLVFHTDDAGARRNLHAALKSVFADRLRVSDEFGHLDSNRLAAVLPATSGASAWAVADDVSLRLPPDLPLPKCEVYAYPGEQSGEMHKVGHDRPDQRAVVGADGNSKDEHSSNGDKTAGPPADRERKATPAHCQEAGSRAALPLEPLLIRPLPWWKRSFDIAVASTALVGLSPIFLLLSLAVRLTSPGPVLFRQMRSGLGGRPFVFFKFRSMVHDAEARKADLLPLNEQDGPAFKIRHDPRVTSLGRFLRKTSLDELPQLWNVLRGDMSLVGPRPLPCNESDACTGWHRRRLEITPGLTCIWQVEGRSQVSFSDWVRMDIRYMACRSLMLDFLLIVRTLPAMVLRRGS